MSSEIVDSLLNELAVNVVSATEKKQKHCGSQVHVKLLESWKNAFDWLNIEGSGDEMHFKSVQSSRWQVYRHMRGLVLFRKIQ